MNIIKLLGHSAALRIVGFFGMMLLYASLFPVTALSNEDPDAFSDGPTALDTFVLTVDVKRERRPISPYLYGVNAANWCPWYYLKALSDKIVDADVEVVRWGATNMERYNPITNRMYNVISMQNEIVPVSWQTFVHWTNEILKAKPMLQASVFGNVAGDGEGLGDPGYSRLQSVEEVMEWVRLAGDSVKLWGIGNEPWIAWKREDYPGIYHDAAHGDQVLNAHTAHDHFFNRFISVADAIKSANPEALVFGPTPANWWLYWFNDYSPFCPVTTPNGPAVPDAPQWQLMMDPASKWDRNIFPDTGDDPEIAGWERDPRKNISQYLIRMYDKEMESGTRVADSLDLHRYIRCLNEKDAIQEPRGLYQADFASWDAETLYDGTKTDLLNRIDRAIEAYYPKTKRSFSEYGYFYWNGFPSIPQVSAVGMVDFLGFFARGGVDLACSWYLGEPNQSGERVTRAADSARQAMFDEMGNPNPKYWAFYLMSHWFRGTVVHAKASDWERFSVHACQREDDDIVVVAINKGLYDLSGAFIEGQPAFQAKIKGIPEEEGHHLTQIYRLGQNDPGVVSMALEGLDLINGTLTFNFEPLAIYTFVFSPSREVSSYVTDRDTITVSPGEIHFGPYETGQYTEGGGWDRIPHVTVTNTSGTAVNWSVTKTADWLSVQGEGSGTTRVSDRIYLSVDRAGLSIGTHRTDLHVKTASGTMTIPVSLDVIPGEKGGEKRLFDGETGSLAHAYNLDEPYSVGWWGGHGGDGDRNYPFIYEFSIERFERHRLGNRYAMKIDFNRANGDTDGGRLFQSFGSYGHRTFFSDERGHGMEANATGDWERYTSFSFDIKPDTSDQERTELLLLITDEAGNVGKPDVGIDALTDLISLHDGVWQTVTIPLESRFFNWAYPEGQDGSDVSIDFSSIRQIEMVPWAGDPEKKGGIYLDNLRVTRPMEGMNQFPVAVVPKVHLYTRPGEAILLDGTKSVDPDGDALTYQWLPGDYLSEPESPTPLFLAEAEGDYLVELIVIDSMGATNRNIVQLRITVTEDGDEDESISRGVGSTGGGCFIDLLMETFF